MSNQSKSARLLMVATLICQTAGNRIALAVDPITPVHLVGHEDAELLDRVQDLIDDWDPRKLVNPVFETTETRTPDGSIVRHKLLRRADLKEFIADVEAAEVLGKAFFWEMQAGSDFRRLDDGSYVGTACASCHYRNGADVRSRHTQRIPYVVWERFQLDPAHPLEFGANQLPFEVKNAATSEVSFPPAPGNNPAQPNDLALIVGSSGVEPRLFKKLNPLPVTDPGGGWEFEVSSKREVEKFMAFATGYRPEWSMFIDGNDDNGQRFRQITARNTPTIINRGFADRLFHDGRAESTFNGFSIFGDRDKRPVLFRGVPRQHPDGTTMTDDTGSPIYGQPVHVDIAITKAALASQAVGPIVNDVEMSYLGRAFPNVACKLLPAKVLAHQTIDPDDSVLGRWKRQGLIGPGGTLNYGELIRLAFRREWWDGGKCPPEQAAGTQPSDGAGITSVSPDDCSCGENVVPLILLADDNDPTNLPYGTLMQANFSLYWGLSIMIFESSLVSNQSPFDGMMQGNPTLVEARWQKEKSNLGTIRLDRSTQNDTPPPEHQTGTAVFQHGFRVFMNRGCVECHSGPLFSELYERQPEDEKLPIYEQLSHTLLPNSRSDSIGYRRDLFHEQVISQIAELLQREGELSSHATRELADSFDLLRELAQGSVADLQVRIEAHLQPLGMTHLAADIASMLMTFEKSAHRYFGDRHFFNEDERIEMAEQLTEPVLVEKMPIPLRVAPLRPRLPIAGPLATEDYAFYDLAFYAIGVSPARYDPGVGDFEPPVLRREQLAEQALTDINAQTDATGALPDSPEKNLRLQSLESIRNELQAYRDQAPNLDRQLSQPTVEVLRKVTQRTMAQKPSIGAPGQAYRLRSTPQLRRTDLEAVSDQSGRTCELGPTTSPDAEFWDLPAPADFTWSRNHLPEDHRRSELAFRSRARTLVSDEEPWGFRKPLLHDNELAFWGSFQTPSLRNVELTAPYMHNGRIRHLGDVIDFYDRGGDILTDKTLYPDKHPQIGDALSDEDILDLSENDKLALRFFLLCLTDERVRLEQGPFDHPSLRLVHGYDQNLNERVAVVAAVGNKGWTDSSGNAVLNKIPQLFPELE